jgi:hypothetical protein
MSPGPENHLENPTRTESVGGAQDVVTLGCHVGASHSRVNVTHGVGSGLVGRTLRFSLDIQLRAIDLGAGRGVAAQFLVFQSPGGLGALDLAHVVNAGARLARSASFDEVGDSDRRQHTDDRDYDHDFNEGESCLPKCI